MIYFKLLSYTLLAFLFSIPGKSQQKQRINLVANGGFDDINTCTEFDAVCEPDAWFFLPTYTVEPQKNRNNIFEIISVGNVFHGSRGGNYLYTRLLCPLVQGKKYQYSIWIATPKNEFDHLDVHFTNAEPQKLSTLFKITSPSFSLTAKNVDSSKPRWKKYAYIYTAKGDEKFMIMGNFSNTSIDRSKVSASNKAGDVLYAIDDIAFRPLDKNEKSCGEYNARIKQLYDQNFRHPPRLIEKVPLDSFLITGYKRKGSSNNLNANDNTDTVRIITHSKSDTLIIPDILFEFNSSKLNPAFINKMETVLKAIGKRKPAAIEIIGHTDNVGSERFNEELSLNRATTIKAFIVSKLALDDNLFTVKGMGETQPVDNNHTGLGRKRNRRVEIILKE